MLQTITQGEWGGEYTKLNQMFAELATYAGTSYIPIWEDWWANIFQDLNSNFEVLYTELGGTGRESFLIEETWGDVRGKMNTMFPYLYGLAESEVEFEVTGSPPIEGVGINVSYYLNYISSAVTDINPSTVTFSSNYFTIPLDVDEFTFEDGETLMEAVNRGGWSVSEPENLILIENTGFLKNPDCGFQRWAGEFTWPTDYVDNVDFEISCMYARTSWRALEPTEGVYDWSVIDDWITACQARGWSLSTRISCINAGWGDAYGIPDWLVTKGVPMTSFEYGGNTYYAPDMDDATFKTHHDALINAFGTRYNGHPDISLIDIGSVGYWGEWHTYTNWDLMPSETTMKHILDLYHDNFPDTPLTISNDAYFLDWSIEGLVDNMFQYISDKGNCGWRGDSWADKPEGEDPPWNFHDYYALLVADNIQVWKTGAVAFEPHGSGVDAVDMDIEGVIDDTIAWKATFVTNKHQVIPSGDWATALERLMKVIGYRICMRDISYNSEVVPGSELNFTIDYKNAGIAPPYRDRRFAFRLRSGGVTINEKITDYSLKGKIPGSYYDQEVIFDIDIDTPEGEYTIDMALVLSGELDYTAPLANYGELEDGWYSVGNLSVEKKVHLADASLLHETGEQAAALDSLSLDYTVPAGANFLLVFVSANNQNVTGVTYGGEAMTLREGFGGSWEPARGWMYVLENPTEGENTLAITLAVASWSIGVVALAFEGFGEIVSSDERTSRFQTINPSAFTLVTQKDDYIVDFCRWTSSDDSSGIGDEQTVITSDGAADIQKGSYKIATGTSSTISQEITVSDSDWDYYTHTVIVLRGS